MFQSWNEHRTANVVKMEHETHTQNTGRKSLGKNQPYIKNGHKYAPSHVYMWERKAVVTV
jgi:hypothetical protein